MSDWSKKANLVPLAKVTSEGWQCFGGRNKGTVANRVQVCNCNLASESLLKVKVSNCRHLHLLAAVLANTQVQFNNLLLGLYAAIR